MSEQALKRLLIIVGVLFGVYGFVALELLALQAMFG